MIIMLFTAPWCSVCKVLYPRLEEYMPRIKEKFNEVRLEVINVDARPDAANTYGVMSLPTIVVTDDIGNPLASKQGLVTYEQLESLITNS